MKKYCNYIFSLLMMSSLSAETVFKNLNPDGSVEFTDRETKNSKEIKVRKPVTYKPLNLPPLSQPKIKKKAAAGYSINITQPASDSSITGTADVQVVVSILPALSPGYKLRYQIGSEVIENEQTSTLFRNVNRGTHNLSVSVVDSNGEIIGSSASITFHMKRFFKKPSPAKPKTP